MSWRNRPVEHTRGGLHVLLILALLSSFAPLTVPVRPALAATPLRFSYRAVPNLQVRDQGAQEDSRAAAIGDIDGDGYLDVLVVNANDDGVIYRGAADGSIDANGTFGANYSSIALGDINRDGQLDAVVGNSGGQSAVLLGLNTVVPVGPTNTNTSSVAVGDLDRDGWLDLVLAVNGGQSAVYLNNQNGGFEAPITVGPAAAASSDVALGYLNDDAFLDIVLGVNNGQSAAYLSNAGNDFNTVRNVGPVNATTTSVAIGDLNADAAPDIVLGSNADQSAAYLNDGNAGFAATSPFGVPDAVNDVALGDLDADGDLDIVTAVRGVNGLYLNDGSGTFAANSTAFSRNAASSGLALADLNHDGYLDVFVALLGYNDLYSNNGGGRSSTGLALAQSDGASSPVLADLDNDGDLDLVASRAGNAANAYLNNGSGSFAAPTAVGVGEAGSALAAGDLIGNSAIDLVVASVSGLTLYQGNGNGTFAAGNPIFADGPVFQVDIGDLDNDGDLDLVGRQFFAPLLIFRNNGNGTFSSTSTPTNEPAAFTLGDLDNDGNPDIVVMDRAGSETELRILRNTGSGSFSAEFPFSPGILASYTSMKLGDMNGDGNLDMVLGQAAAPGMILLNDGSGFATQAVIFSFDQSPFARRIFGIGTEKLALSDSDGDGDLDILAANSGQASVIYLNDGRATFDGNTIERDFNQALSGLEIGAVAVGDLTGDGMPDVLLAGAPAMVVFPNPVGRQGRLPNIHLDRPGSVADAQGFSTPQILGGPNVTIPYRLSDVEGVPVRRIRAFFSSDGGANWREAKAAAGTQTTNLAAAINGTAHTFGWDVYASGVFGRLDNVIFRIEAYPGSDPSITDLAGPFQRSYAVAESYPFRVRGTQVRVLKSDNSPAPQALVYRIPAGQISGTALAAANDTPFSTNSLGDLAGRGQLNPGDKIVALAPISETVKYTFYQTSAATTTTGLNAYTVGAPGVQTLTVRPENPLIVFKLRVSLEWDARGDTAFMNQVQADLQRTSELLYRWSDGQIALGSITFYYNKQFWEEADIQIYASNQLRPNANQGGITTVDRVDPDIPTITYEPGQIRMGAVWNRYGDNDGAIGEDWPRALAHEIGHYALYLDEDYLGLDAENRLISVESCPSPMADPYRDDYGKFRPDNGWLPACADTLNQRVSGRSNWATLKKMYDTPALGFSLRTPSSFNPSAGPEVLPLQLTTFSNAETGQLEPVPPGAALIVRLSQPSGSVYRAGANARAFLYRNERLLDLGAPEQNSVTARGAQPGDRLCLYDLDEAALGCGTLSSGNLQLTVEAKPGWQPQLLLTPVTSRTFSLNLSNVPSGLTVKARMYPIEGQAETGAVTTLSAQNGGYGGTLATEQPVLAGYVQVWIDEPGNRREMVSDFALGGNPAPPRKPRKRKNRRAPALSPDGQVVLFSDNLTFPANSFFAIQRLTRIPATAPAWATPVGQPYRLLASPNAPSLNGVALNMGYLESDFTPGTEGGIAIYYLADGATTWQLLATRIDELHNEASGAALGPGTYALMSRVPLSVGWNMLSYPWPAVGIGVKEGMDLIGGNNTFSTVYGYEPADNADPWKVYDVDAPSFVNDLTTLQYGRGYWVLATNGSVTVASRLAQVGNPERPATYYATIGGSAGRSVQARIGTTICAETTTRSVSGTTVFVIDVPAATEHPGCGTFNSVVTFIVDGQTFAATTWEASRPHEIRAGTSVTHLLFLPSLWR